MLNPLVALGIVFAVIIGLLWLKRPLFQAILGALAALAFMYRIPPNAWLSQTCKVFTNYGSFSILLSLYLITFLQRQLEKRQQIKSAQQDLDGIFHNRRINAAVAPLFIGLLPSAAAMILCGDIVKDSTEGYLNTKEQALVTSWYRHIPESSLPTYTGVLLMCNLSGVPLPEFMSGMLIPILVLIMLGFPYLRKLPRFTGTKPSQNKKQDILSLLHHLWPLLLILALILILKLSVVPAVLLAITAEAVAYKFSFKEMRPFVRSAFEKKLQLNTFLVLVLKEFISYTGLLAFLPQTLAVLPIPFYLIFSLLFFLGGVISGTTGIIALGTPLAFAALPNGGMPLMVLLMCMCHAASQVSPTHVCLIVASDYYNITLGSLIRKTFPLSLFFALLMLLYYNILLKIIF